MTTPLISVKDLSKSFSGPDGKPVPVLDGISLDVDEGEFVALLGRSGSGKSTLLRCIAGLIAPTDGEVLFRGKRLTGTNRETTMVFQTFALLPWLTVQENVELGLEARGVQPAERAERAVRAIDLVGLDGYESAYPKELSGGMRQRVGFARALVVEPAALLMDEPFSALDVLTSENLRGELLEIWEGQRFPTKTMVMVTHNIEEAVLLADRILILGTSPGRIRADLRNPLARPRQRRTADFDALVDEIYRMMTHREATYTAPSPAGQRGPGSLNQTPLPQATVDGLSGLAEILYGRHDGAADVADLAEGLGLSVDDLLPLVDALAMLGFAEVSGDRLELSSAGRVFAGASIQDSKEIFARAALEHAPLVRTIFSALKDSLDGTLPAGFFTDILRASMGEDEAGRQLDLAVNWGRYAELYAYDADKEQITREENGIGATLGDVPAPVARGALHLYLGAAPGSGKTFTMLREGRARGERGEDVVVGLARTHGRPRTEEAIDGLEMVPSSADAMDTGAVLKRHPAIALVDDFRQNAAGIEQLREAGIDVISTVDVTDLDRAADIVASATGKRPPRTISDAELAQADDIRFVDNSPEALRKRLGHGNIYPADRASIAVTGLFSVATLARLREIGLQVVTETITGPATGSAATGPAATGSAAIGSAAIGTATRGSPSGPAGVLVAVLAADQGAPLVRRGVRLARPGGATCTVLVSSEDAVTVKSLARDAGANVIVRSGTDAGATITQTVHETGARHLVLAGTSARLLSRWRPSLEERLARQLPDVHLHIAGTGDTPAAAPAAQRERIHERGTVRVYLGYAPGCGSTSAMLEEAGRRRSRGSDVVVATVETRGREAVHAALEGLELAGDGTALDASAVLRRRPEVVCVDDLTAAGPDGQNRISGARRLAEAGLNVIATVSMGSMRDNPTDEEAVLALADEMELVDVPPAALAERARRGEIAATGASLEDLTALREQAFGIVAEHAERQLAAYRQRGGSGPDAGGPDGSGPDGDGRPVILTCAIPLTDREPLIRRASALAARVAGDFLVATVTAAGSPDPHVDSYRALTAQLGGEFAVLHGAPAAALAEFARQRGVTELLLARDAVGDSHRFPLLRELVRATVGSEIHLLPAHWIR
ncbi:MAG TPA: AAA-associated domain-containing protein [Streptosporangiaceae bacterium]